MDLREGRCDKTPLRLSRVSIKGSVFLETPIIAERAPSQCPTSLNTDMISQYGVPETSTIDSEALSMPRQPDERCGVQQAFPGHYYR